MGTPARTSGGWLSDGMFCTNLLPLCLLEASLRLSLSAQRRVFFVLTSGCLFVVSIRCVGVLVAALVGRKRLVQLGHLVGCLAAFGLLLLVLLDLGALET